MEARPCRPRGNSLQTYSRMRQIVFLPYFKRQLKPLVKKHRGLKNSVIEAVDAFDPSRHAHLGSDVYKVRIGTPSLRRGKGESFRLILLVVEVDGLLVPVTIYFKGERQTLTQKELDDHIQHVTLELKNRERD